MSDQQITVMSLTTNIAEQICVQIVRLRVWFSILDDRKLLIIFKLPVQFQTLS